MRGVVLAACAALLASCGVGSREERGGRETLRRLAREMEESVEWSGGAGAKAAARDDTRLLGAAGAPRGLFLIRMEPPVFARPRGFPELDLSGLSGDEARFIESVSSSLESRAPSEGLFSPDFAFSLAEFHFDADKTAGGKEFFFHALGRPVRSGSLLQCPVRLFLREKGERRERPESFSDEHLDAFLYIRSGSGGLECVNIEIIGEQGGI